MRRKKEEEGDSEEEDGDEDQEAEAATNGQLEMLTPRSRRPMRID